MILKIFCRHNYQYIRKLYGDEINLYNGKRFEYRCTKCGIYKFCQLKADFKQEWW